MKFNFWILCAGISCLALSCTREDLTAQLEESSSSEEGIYTNVIDIKFSEDMVAGIESGASAGLLTKSSEFNSLASEYGITSLEKIFTEDERYPKRYRKAGLHLWYTATIDPSLVTVTKAADNLLSIDGVLIAEPQHKVKLMDIPFDDPYSSDQWALYQTSGVDINVIDVWNTYGTGSEDVIVCVVDTGVEATHADLSDAFIAAGVGGSRNFYGGNYNISAGDHGTHVAGVIAATNNNGIGICGIAGGDYEAGQKGVKILSCQVFSSDGSSSANSANAIIYGADNGAVISQNSWGYTYETEAQAKNATLSSVMQTAIDYFIEYAGCDDDGNQLPDSPMKGGLVIFAAGNDGWQYGLPASYEPVIAVGAIDKNGSRASYSNYGDWVDICAPGTNIYSTVTSNSYSNMSGTSMACPQVSGVAALVLSIAGGYGFTADNLKEALIYGASSDKITATQVGPLVDALGALSYLTGDAPDAITSVSASARANTIDVTWNVTGNSDGTPAYGATIYVGKSQSLFDDLDPNSPGSSFTLLNVLTNEYSVGDEVTFSVTGLDFNTTYYVTVAPYNYGARYGDYPSPVQVVTGENNPPTITTEDSTEGIQLTASSSITLTFTIEDPDSHSVTVTHTPGSDAESSTLSGSSLYLYLRGSNADAGTYTSTITAEDEYGASTSYSFTYEVLENHAPEVSATLEGALIEQNSQAKIDLSEYFSDPDGDDLSYSASSSSSSTHHAAVTSGILYVTSLGVGTSTITVTASDPRGLSVSQSFSAVTRASGEVVNVYPTQVTDSFYVATGGEVEEAKITVISSATGKTVYEATHEASIFNPTVVDASNFATGPYTVNVSYGSVSGSKSIVKL